MTWRRPLRRSDVPALTDEDFTDAGLHLVGEAGWAALTIARICARLRVTKGSFYWHFVDRAAFARAVLARWEHLSTAGTEAQIAGVVEPRERLRRLLTLVIETAGPIELDTAIFSARGDPLVSAAIDRVTPRRLAILSRVYEELGLAADEAQRWALTAYSTFLGLIALGRGGERLLRNREARRSYAQHVLALLVPKAR